MTPSQESALWQLVDEMLADAENHEIGARIESDAIATFYRGYAAACRDYASALREAILREAPATKDQKEEA